MFICKNFSSLREPLGYPYPGDQSVNLRMLRDLGRIFTARSVCHRMASYRLVNLCDNDPKFLCLILNGSIEKSVKFHV